MLRIATVMTTVLCLTPALVTAQEPQCNNIPFPGATTAFPLAAERGKATSIGFAGPEGGGAG